MGSIVALRNEIQEYIKLIGMTEYNLSDEEKMVLDEFFNRSSNRVIENLLERLRHVLSDDKRSMEFSTGFVPRKKFKDTYKILYKCTKCNQEHKNIIATDDNMDLIIKLSVQL